MGQGIDQGGGAVRGHDSPGVTVKSDNQRKPVVLACICEGLTDDLLMTEMNAVEDADGQRDPASMAVQFGGLADELHD